MKIRTKSPSLVSAAALAILLSAVVSSAQAQVVSFEYSNTENVFSTIAGVSNEDLAAGITTERDFTGGNFGAALTTDGLYGTGFGNNPSNSVAGTTPLIRYRLDLGSSLEIDSITSYSFGDSGGVRASQVYTLYGSNNANAATSFDEAELDGGSAVWSSIAAVDMGESALAGNVWGASNIADINESYQYLMWVTEHINIAANNRAEYTVWKEFDVIAVPEASSFALLAGLSGLGFVMLRRRK